jgi:hypothetical protein
LEQTQAGLTSAVRLACFLSAPSTVVDRCSTLTHAQDIQPLTELGARLSSLVLRSNPAVRVDALSAMIAGSTLQHLDVSDCFTQVSVRWLAVLLLVISGLGPSHRLIIGTQARHLETLLRALPSSLVTLIARSGTALRLAPSPESANALAASHARAMDLSGWWADWRVSSLLGVRMSAWLLFAASSGIVCFCALPAYARSQPFVQKWHDLHPDATVHASATVLLLLRRNPAGHTTGIESPFR